MDIDQQLKEYKELVEKLSGEEEEEEFLFGDTKDVDNLMRIFGMDS